jgi:murein DD-endopeptidase MepM/ murein hydrolase activator NlpD
MHREYTTDRLAAGDTLGGLLARAKVDVVEADAALDELRTIFDVRRLKPEQEVRVFREWPAGEDPQTHPGRFAGFDFIPEPRRRLIVRRTDFQQFAAIEEQRALSERFFLSDSLITSSVYEAARSGGMSPNLVVALIRLFSFTIDFQRDIREGDQLEVLYTRRFDDNNQLAEEGDIMFAALTNRGKRYAYWRVPHDDGSFGYYDEEGRSVQRLLMRTPVDGARLSSRFGMRRHPILGYTRLHRGLDFAAPTGTPIYAAGDGVITRIGTYGSNGKYIRIRHKNGYETAYAHMNGFARRLKKGSRVRQGQVIGYVGRTGLATGPHLHYEVMHYDKPVNPRELNVPAQTSLKTTAQLDAIKNGLATRVANLASSDNSLRSLPRRRAALRSTGE